MTLITTLIASLLAAAAWPAWHRQREESARIRARLDAVRRSFLRGEDAVAEAERIVSAARAHT